MFGASALLLVACGEENTGAEIEDSQDDTEIVSDVEADEPEEIVKDNGTDKVEEVIEDDETEEVEEIEVDDSFPVGDTIEFQYGHKITITNIELSNKEPNGEINHNLVRVDFTLDNQSSKPLDFNSHSVELYDGERNKAEVNSEDFYSTTFATGVKGNGSVYFDSIAKGPFTVRIGTGTWVSE